MKKSKMSMFQKMILFLLAMIAACVFLTLGCLVLGSVLPKPPPSSSSPVQSRPSSRDNVVTYEEYTQAKEGMTYEELTAIWGEGAERGDKTLAGHKVIRYSWKGDKNFSHVYAVFMDGKLDSKSQTGLEP